MKPKPAVRSLLAPLRMFDGMDEEETPKKKPEPVDGPLLTERDKIKIERRKRKEERQREVSHFVARGCLVNQLLVDSGLHKK